MRQHGSPQDDSIDDPPQCEDKGGDSGADVSDRPTRPECWRRPEPLAIIHPASDISPGEDGTRRDRSARRGLPPEADRIATDDEKTKRPPISPIKAIGRGMSRDRYVSDASSVVLIPMTDLPSGRDECREMNARFLHRLDAMQRDHGAWVQRPGFDVRRGVDE
jgi:hypothetical protein